MSAIILHFLALSRGVRAEPVLPSALVTLSIVVGTLVCLCAPHTALTEAVAVLARCEGASEEGISVRVVVAFLKRVKKEDAY